VTPSLETARLRLEPLELDDAGQIQLLFPHWDIVRLLANVIPWPYPPDGALTYIRDLALPAVARGEEWHWTLRLKTAPAHVIGCINLKRSSDSNHENRGFWIGIPWQRQGLMTEAADAVNEYWFNTLKCPVLRVSKTIANVASRRVSEKQGMRIVATAERDYVSGRMPAEIWEITAEEWNRRRSLA